MYFLPNLKPIYSQICDLRSGQAQKLTLPMHTAGSHHFVGQYNREIILYTCSYEGDCKTIYQLMLAVLIDYCPYITK